MNGKLRPITVGLLAAVFGIALAVTPAGLWLEENIGLWVLFSLRNTIAPPSNVIVVAIDRKVSSRLDLHQDPWRWPRTMHARLLQAVTQYRPAVVGFDLFFAESRDNGEDQSLAGAMAKIGNAVLCQKLEAETEEVLPTGVMIQQEKLLPISPRLAEAAVASAPFPLPKESKSVNYYWSFRGDLADFPTLPVVIFQLLAKDVSKFFFTHLLHACPTAKDRLKEAEALMHSPGEMIRGVQIVRGIFNENKGMEETVKVELEQAADSYTPQQRRLLQGLLRLYGGLDHHYLNYYGPVRTIRTIPYDAMMHPETDPDIAKLLPNAVLLIGLSEIIPSEQRDAFYTVYSKNGIDLPGVEILATAVANLIDGTGVQPLSFPVFIGLITVWGGLLGGICGSIRPTRMAIMTISLGALYTLGVIGAFVSHGIWYPLAIPVVVQAPFIIFISSIWHAWDAHKQQERVRIAFMEYLPEQVVDELINRMGAAVIKNKEVFGVCLYSDVARYTQLSESLPPADLAVLMNQYYEVLVSQIKKHGGIVANIVGDSMLAMWVEQSDDRSTRTTACRCAVEIQRVLAELRKTGVNHALTTRIGLHAGGIVLGQIGAVGHFEYRPIGDIVNTATRLEGLNKMVSTSILASEDVVSELETNSIRYVGRFVFVGKESALAIYELRTESSPFAGHSEQFSEALRAYERGELAVAGKLFTELLTLIPDDGPSLFYLDKCSQLHETPTDAFWNGEIRLQRK